MVHKPNPERDTFNKYSTDGPARDYLDSPDVFSSWKTHFKKTSGAAGTSNGEEGTAKTLSGGLGISRGEGIGSGAAETPSGVAGTVRTYTERAGSGANGTSSSSGKVNLSSDQISTIVEEVLKHLQKKA